LNFIHQSNLQFNSSETIQEASARLLFMSIKWCKSLPSFMSLSQRDQINLLEESWSEIFLLCALQWSLQMEINPLLSANDLSPDKSSLRLISELIVKFKMLNLDAAEFAFLKAIVLFKSGNY
jgi:nuclear receptor subfamily 2 group E protein 3